MITADSLFLRRLRSEWRFQYDLWKTVVDWTIALYLIIPALLLFADAYRSWWLAPPLWLAGLPAVIPQSLLLLFIFTGRMRIFVEEADHLFLLRQRSWHRRIVALGIFYSLGKELLLTVLLFLLLAPFLTTGYGLAVSQIALLIGVTFLFRAVMALSRQLLTLRYADWKGTLLFFLLFSLAGLLFRTELVALAGPPLAPTVFAGWGSSSILEKPNGPGVPPTLQDLSIPSPQDRAPQDQAPLDGVYPAPPSHLARNQADPSAIAGTVEGGHIDVIAATTVIALTVLLGYLIRLRLNWKGHFFHDVARERQERLRYAALILNAAGFRFRKPNRRRQRPIAFRRSNALFRRRAAVDILTEACLKTVLRSRSRLSQYGQMTLLGLFAVTIASGLWKWALWIGAIVVMTQWTGYYWKETIHAEFVQLFRWTVSDQRLAAERALFLLSLPSLLLISAVAGFQSFSWLGAAAALPLGSFAGYVTANMISYFGVIHHEQPAQETDL
ncbi:hypothetical protein GTO91_11830 [Heliobacterium undosum]|uniref:Uncharacterized protein n=1 Tax=Heliomicrobium undosum TaxID=121734 RepID=A0A845L1G7_9FIRM|nr:ABC transporter permease [Heliomicrobium undosum]MZP30402.1 hypothetical protein [Heliomicrobium undosum]